MRWPLRSTAAAVALALATVAAPVTLLTPTVAHAFPKPSTAPVSWELNFTHSKPKRITVDVPGEGRQAYWYMTYSVVNNTDEERPFLPYFELVTDDGQVIGSDRRIPFNVFQAIKAREKNRFLEHYTSVSGSLRIGEDEAKEGVAIWKEPGPEMGRFSIFVTGLSGEHVIMKDADGKDLKDTEGRSVILRKTLQLNYLIRGDEVYPGEDEVNVDAEEWVMR
jgi:hypothetical protein